jgi:hypothetical protein
MQQETKTYQFTYHHSNHSVFRGEIVATSIENRDTQALSLLSQRYRRNLPLEGVHGKMEFTLIEEVVV